MGAAKDAKKAAKQAAERNTCSICGKKIETMAYRGTGVCSHDCKKKRDGDAPATTLVSVPTSKVHKRPSNRGVPRVQG